MTACDEVGDISVNPTCPLNRVIKVNYANFGRTSTTVCDSVGLNEKTDCTMFREDYTAFAKRICDWQNECIVNKMPNQIDPCYMVYKYLEVRYECNMLGR